jgi:hypothetical protein
MAMTITATATGTTSTVELDSITNTFGTITLNTSGAGSVNATTNTATLRADDITMNIASGGGTYDVINATDDIVITAANTASLTLSSLDSGATTAGTISVAASGSGDLTISDVVTSAGAMSINAAAATGSVQLLSADDYTGAITFTGGTGNDSVISGSGNDVISTGDGIDSINSATGNDSIDAGAGNDTVTFDTAGDLTTADTVNGGDGTDTLNLTIDADIASTSTISNFEVIALTANDGVGTVNLRNNNVTTLTVADGTDVAFTLTNLASGVAVRLTDQGATDLDLTVDVVDGGSITIDARGDQTDAANNDVIISDAESVTVTAGSTTADDYDFDELALDDIDTTSLTVTGSAVASSTLAFGATEGITNSNGLTSYTVNARASGADVTVGALADADSLTSLTLTGSANGDISIGSVGGTGTAERLAAIALTAAGGSQVTINGTVTADTTDSVSDLSMTMTGTADDGSTIAFGTINNQFGVITATLSGAGVVGGTELSSDDMTIAWSAGGSSTIGTITVTDDLTLTNSGSGAHTITTLAVGGDAVITHTGSGTLTITTVNNGADAFTVNAADATGALIVTTNSIASAATVTNLTGGTAADSLTGGVGNDVLTGGAGVDTITGGTGRDTIAPGAGADLLVVNSTVGTGSDSGRVTVTGNDNDTGEDSVDGFNFGSDTIRIVATAVASFVHGTDTAIGTATGSKNDGTVGSFSVSTGLVELNQTTDGDWDDAGDVSVSFVNPAFTVSTNTAITEQLFEDALQYNITGTTADNVITTGALADTITGGTGGDIITPGAGADVIVFSAVTDGEGFDGADSDNVLNAGLGEDLTETTALLAGSGDIIAGFVAGSDTVRIDGTLEGLLEAAGATVRITAAGWNWNAAGIVIVDDSVATVADFGDASAVAAAIDTAAATSTNTTNGDEFIIVLALADNSQHGIYYFKDADAAADLGADVGDSLVLLGIISLSAAGDLAATAVTI